MALCAGEDYLSEPLRGALLCSCWRLYCQHSAIYGRDPDPSEAHHLEAWRRRLALPALRSRAEIRRDAGAAGELTLTSEDCDVSEISEMLSDWKYQLQAENTPFGEELPP